MLKSLAMDVYRRLNLRNIFAHPRFNALTFQRFHVSTLPRFYAFTLPTLSTLLPFLGLTLLALFLTGCANPIGATKSTARLAYRQASASALTGRISNDSRLVLRRFSLDEIFKSNPAEALKLLHDRARTDDRRDLVFALAELSYWHGYQVDHSLKTWVPKVAARDYYLSAAIYAYLYLFGPGQEPPPGEFDHRVGLARELYNISLAKGLGSPERTNAVVVLEAGTRHLPAGDVKIALDTHEFPHDPLAGEKFLAADEFFVRGLSVRNRQSGLGAPLIMINPREGKTPPQHYPATAFLQFSGNLKTWGDNPLQATLGLYSGYGVGTVQVNGKAIPLQTDLTAPMAYALNENFLWQIGISQFFSSKELIKSGIYLSEPYQAGRIPVVLVHGTFSSPVWWAEMVNTLRADPEVGRRCQFWYFIYNSGNPVAYSAVRLREAMTAKIAELDPEGKDPALQQMVVIGHSQGGLLAKLTATDTGDKLWEATITNRAAILKLTPAEREFLQQYAVFEHLPFVKRVVFISTPHRGSYLAGNLVRQLAYRLIKLPGKFVKQATKLSGVASVLGIQGTIRVPTSLDSMSGNNKMLLTLADIPLAPGIKGHSIISVEGNGDYHHGRDGLVAYPSAHVDYVESEFIVRSFHTCQEKPATIEEVRRILLEHLGSVPLSTNSNLR